MKKIIGLSLFVLLFVTATFAKDATPQVLNWPSEDKPLLRFTVGKFRQVGEAYAGQKTFIVDTTVDNLSGKGVTNAVFNLFVWDKNNVRIGDGYLDLRNVRAGESIKIQVNIQSGGTPVRFSLAAQELPAEFSAYAPQKKISVTVYSVPAGANLSLDGKPAGVTPIAVMLPPGSHTLEFAKDGFNRGTFPLVTTPDQLSGGSVSYELGTSAHDTLELRDGAVLTCDVESVGATEVVVRMGGNVQTYSRNQVKRILFTVREQ